MVSGRGFVCSLGAQSTLLCLHAKVDVGRWRARATPFCDDLQMFTVDSTAVSHFERAKLSHQRISSFIPSS